MGRLGFVASAFGIIAGFSVYEYGHFLTLNPSQSVSSWTLTHVPWIGSPTVLVGAVIQLVGGALAVACLLFCIEKELSPTETS